MPIFDTRVMEVTASSSNYEARIQSCAKLPLSERKEMIVMSCGMSRSFILRRTGDVELTVTSGLFVG